MIVDLALKRNAILCILIKNTVFIRLQRDRLSFSKAKQNNNKTTNKQQQQQNYLKFVF